MARFTLGETYDSAAGRALAVGTLG
jgi:hypothetical protein